MNKVYDSIVIGAGQAGLAAAYYLQQKNMEYLVLEKSNQTAGSWPDYYDSLTLFSPLEYSSLPGRAFQGKKGHYPSKSEVISYLTQYTKHFRLNVHTESNVVEVIKNSDVFLVKTSEGLIFKTKTLISATGAFSFPYLPEITGSHLFDGEIIHSSQYRMPEKYNNKRVIVIGAGNSAIQIAYELADKADVTLATRQPIKFIPQTILGKDIHFWFNVTGLNRWPFAKKMSLNNSVLDTGIYKQAIMMKKPDRRPMFKSITEKGVIWENGSEESVDTIIFATGFRPNLRYLISLKGALNEKGVPLHENGVSNSVRGLFYVGLSGQRSFASATLRGVGRDAKYIINKVKSLVE